MQASISTQSLAEITRLGKLAEYQILDTPPKKNSTKSLRSLRAC